MKNFVWVYLCDLKIFHIPLGYQCKVCLEDLKFFLLICLIILLFIFSIAEYKQGEAVEQAETKAIKRALRETGAHVVVNIGSGDTVVSYLGPADKSKNN